MKLIRLPYWTVYLWDGQITFSPHFYLKTLTNMIEVVLNSYKVLPQHIVMKSFNSNKMRENTLSKQLRRRRMKIRYNWTYFLPDLKTLSPTHKYD